MRRACRFLVEEGEAEVAEADLRSGRGLLGLGEGGTRLSPPEDDVDVGEAEPAAAAAASFSSAVSIISHESATIAATTPPTDTARCTSSSSSSFLFTRNFSHYCLRKSAATSPPPPPPPLVFFTVACAAAVAAALHNHYSDSERTGEGERSGSCSSGNTDRRRQSARSTLHRSAHNN